MFTFVYDFALLLLAVISLPKMAYSRWRHHKYAHSFIKRWGKDFPRIEKNGRYLVWIHAVSLGETKVAATLIKKIKKEMANPLIVISSITETGHEEAVRTIFEADYCVYLPFDFSWVVKPIVNRIKPDLVVVCETDLWLNFLRCAKENKANVIVVNGKISEKSQQRLAKFKTFSNRLLTSIDFFCIQNGHYHKRFLKLGVPPSKMAITGNMKFDGIPPALEPMECDKFRKQLGFQHDDQVLVVGSTHDPEEKLILDILEKLQDKFPKLKTIIVPRHPERFTKAAELIEHYQIPYQRFTSLDLKKEAKVLLVDVMGMLSKCYQIATVAIVGGSFTSKVGGHNILEPSWYGVPVLFGPHMFKQPELVELITQYHSGLQVDEHTLAITLEELLLNPQKRAVQGQAGLKMMEELKGVTLKTWEDVKKNIPKSALKPISS